MTVCRVGGGPITWAYGGLKGGQLPGRWGATRVGPGALGMVLWCPGEQAGGPSS